MIHSRVSLLRFCRISRKYCRQGGGGAGRGRQAVQAGRQGFAGSLRKVLQGGPGHRRYWWHETVGHGWGQVGQEG